MARHTANFTGTIDRDKGRLYLITEMWASQGEAWATRVLIAMLGANVNLPDNFKELGMAALAQMGFQALGALKWEDAKPLLAEMMDCVQIIPDPKKTHVFRPLIEEDIEEIPTRLELRMEVWNLHTGFLQAVAPSLVAKVKAAAAKS